MNRTNHTQKPAKGTNKLMLAFGIIIIILPLVIFGLSKLLAYNGDWQDYDLFGIVIHYDVAIAIEVFALLAGIFLIYLAQRSFISRELTDEEKKVWRMFHGWKLRDMDPAKYKEKFRKEKRPWQVYPMPPRSVVIEMSNRLGWNLPVEFVREFPI